MYLAHINEYNNTLIAQNIPTFKTKQKKAET